MFQLPTFNSCFGDFIVSIFVLLGPEFGTGAVAKFGSGSGFVAAVSGLAILLCPCGCSVVSSTSLRFGFP
jgi:hypothetical protein